MVFSCFAVYLRHNHTRVVPYFTRCVWPPLGPYTTQNMVQPVYDYPRRYTAKQLKTIYYCLITTQMTVCCACVKMAQVVGSRRVTHLWRQNLVNECHVENFVVRFCRFTIIFLFYIEHKCIMAIFYIPFTAWQRSSYPCMGCRVTEITINTQGTTSKRNMCSRFLR